MIGRAEGGGLVEQEQNGKKKDMFSLNYFFFKILCSFRFFLKIYILHTGSACTKIFLQADSGLRVKDDVKVEIGAKNCIW